jgi:hypothetical protein
MPSIINFPGFTAIKNFAPYDVEFMWNSTVYRLQAGVTYNMPNELAFGAIKNTIYRIDTDGRTYSCALPADAVPEEDIPPKTGDVATDYLFQDPGLRPFQPLPVAFSDRVRHRQQQKDFIMVADGKGAE